MGCVPFVTPLKTSYTSFFFAPLTKFLALHWRRLGKLPIGREPLELAAPWPPNANPKDPLDHLDRTTLEHLEMQEHQNLQG